MSSAKILVIDDDRKYRDILNEGLQKEGFEILTASDGEEGIVRAEVYQPNLVICDMMMPKKDGFAVLKELRLKLKSRVPFIMLTSVDNFEKVKSAYEYEADLYITKPVVYTKVFESTKLLQNIRVLLSISRIKEGD